jgi:hypothetical protein
VPAPKSPANRLFAKSPALDDSDEDTRVLRTPPLANAVDPALQRLADALAEEAAAAEAEASEFDGEVVDDLSDLGGGGAEPYGQASEAATFPQRLVRRLPSLPALRVAVMSAGAPGEVQIMLLDSAAAPPPGAAVAILVPLTAADGDEVAKLFGSFV